MYQHGNLIKTDASLHLGTSGGHLLNLTDEMIGITTALASLSDYERQAGYTIPVDETFCRIVEQLKRGREVNYGFLVVSPVHLAPSERRLEKHGVRLQQVATGTPADPFDLQRNDVMTHVNGEAIYGPDDLYLLGSHEADRSLDLTILQYNPIRTYNRLLIRHVKLSKKQVC